MTVTQNKTWKILRKHAVKTGNLHLSDLFKEDPDRFNNYKLGDEQLLLDFSKQRINRQTTELLCSLARESDLSAWIEKLFSGDAINTSENRAALHTALRLPPGNELIHQGEDIVKDIHQNLARMEEIVTRIHAGQWRGYSGLAVDTIVNIGVGEAVARAAGFEDADIFAVVEVAAYYAYVNRIADGLGVQLETGVEAEAGE